MSENNQTETEVEKKTKVVEETEVRKRAKIVPPTNFRVILHNNDVTHFDAVVDVLSEVFCNGSRMKANGIMWHAHGSGFAQCLVAPKTICDAKVQEANQCKMKWHQLDPDKYYDQLIFETQPMPSEE